MRVRRADVLVLNYATSGTAPLLGSAGAVAARSASHACVMTHAASGSAPRRCREVRAIVFLCAFKILKPTLRTRYVSHFG